MKLSAAELALCELDPVLGRVIRANGPIVHPTSRDYFAALAESIISQQLSVKASDTIYGRFKAETSLRPSAVMQLTETDTKAIGLSGQKARYIRDLAEHFVRDPAVFNHLENLSDDEVIADLTAVKGIGVWTAQMFLMFTLGRPDIFAPDDLGLINTIITLDKLPTKPLRTELIARAERWAPYRSTACFHLWRMRDNAPKIA